MCLAITKNVLFAFLAMLHRKRGQLSYSAGAAVQHRAGAAVQHGAGAAVQHGPGAAVQDCHRYKVGVQFSK